MSLVPTATNASWMNPIECRFTELRSLAFDGSDYRDWREVRRATRRAVAYRNANKVQRQEEWRTTFMGAALDHGRVARATRMGPSHHTMADLCAHRRPSAAG